MTCLLPITDSLACAEAEKCGACTALKLNLNRFLVLPSDYECMNGSDDPKSCLQLVKDILEKGLCPFSRLAVATLEQAEVSSGQDKETGEINISKGSDGPSPGLNRFWDYTHQIFLPWPYAHMLNGGRVRSIQLNQLPESSDTPVPSNESKIDFTMIRNWISLCRIYHGEECNKAKLQEHEISHPSNELPSFRVIDVVENCLVGDVGKCDYITLSYVWGQVEVLRTLKSNVNILSQPGALEIPEFQEKIPWTVRDAMRVTKEIGFRYLWVDSLCIIQDDDTGEKTKAISKMDLVYGAAFLVILAVKGHNANSGLPGVRLVNRNFQKLNETNPSNLPQTFEPHPIDPMGDRVYYSRGWTFQEQFFARRELTFNGNQALFSCSFDHEVQEKVVFDHNVPYAVFRPQRKEGTEHISKFEELIRNYTMRDLTYESDIHNAFAGIARYISSGLRTSLCHGIPRAFFDWILLWVHLEPLRRRKKAPSWSWSGWVGRSWPNIWQWYHLNIQKVRTAQRKRTWIIWYERIAHESSECICICEDTCSSNEGLMTLKNASGVQLDSVQTIPTSRKLTKAPDYYKPPSADSHISGSGFLQFWTISVTFFLDSPVSVERKDVPKNDNPRIAIYGRSGQELGIVFLAESWRSLHVPGKHEFILLCEGRDERAENGKEDDEEGWKYMVMLIEWHEEWAERVSVGSIGKCDLLEALDQGPVWKEIVLG